MKQMTFNQISQSAVYKADNVSVSITCCGGSYGGGSETLVVAYGFDSRCKWCTEEKSQTVTSNGGGAISPTITGDHQDRITDYTAIVVKYEETIQPSDPE